MVFGWPCGHAGRAQTRLLASVDGAHAMDNHFATADFAHNIPVLLGLLRVWHRSFLGRPSYGLMPYDQRLGRLPAQAQQLEMESNGKSVDRRAARAWFRPADLGRAGHQRPAQLFQWLHRGHECCAGGYSCSRRPSGLDQLASSDQLEAARASHRTLAINAVAQSRGAYPGRGKYDQPHRHFAGNRPSVLIGWDQTTPYALGRLLALYEHITVVSGFIWGLSGFDQWGVELGKQMASQLSQDSSGDGFSRAARAFLATLDEQG